MILPISIHVCGLTDLCFSRQYRVAIKSDRALARLSSTTDRASLRPPASQYNALSTK